MWENDIVYSYTGPQCILQTCTQGRLEDGQEHCHKINSNFSCHKNWLGDTLGQKKHWNLSQQLSAYLY